MIYGRVQGNGTIHLLSLIMIIRTGHVQVGRKSKVLEIGKTKTQQNACVVQTTLRTTASTTQILAKVDHAGFPAWLEAGKGPS